MATAKVSSKYQIVIPQALRQALHIEAGDEVLLELLDGHLIVLPRPKSFAEATRGLMKGRYPADYLQKERDSWE